MGLVYESGRHIDGDTFVINDPGLDASISLQDRLDDSDVAELRAFLLPDTTVAVANQARLGSPDSLSSAQADLDGEVSGGESSAQQPKRRTRTKHQKKPDRHVEKQSDGLFHCIWNNCDDDTKAFPRRCEWNKHMDKHERPYRCEQPGCEKLAGFTYSGGLMRHEREVHGQHGGPKISLNCPVASCKRYQGKGFTRLENLTEHLRRVHDVRIPSECPNATATSEIQNLEDVSSSDKESVKASGKRKRRLDEELDKLQTEVKRLRNENSDQREELEQSRQALESNQQALESSQQALESSQQALKSSEQALKSSQQSLQSIQQTLTSSLHGLDESQRALTDMTCANLGLMAQLSSLKDPFNAVQQLQNSSHGLYSAHSDIPSRSSPQGKQP